MADTFDLERDEDEAAFLARRAAEERRRMAESACLVRTAHEDLAESYEERLDALAATDAAFQALITGYRSAFRHGQPSL